MWAIIYCYNWGNINVNFSWFLFLCNVCIEMRNEMVDRTKSMPRESQCSYSEINSFLLSNIRNQYLQLILLDIFNANNSNGPLNVNKFMGSSKIINIVLCEPPKCAIYSVVQINRLTE